MPKQGRRSVAGLTACRSAIGQEGWRLAPSQMQAVLGDVHLIDRPDAFREETNHLEEAPSDVQGQGQADSDPHRRLLRFQKLPPAGPNSQLATAAAAAPADNASCPASRLGAPKNSSN